MKEGTYMKQYLAPKLLVVAYDSSDVLTTSGGESYIERPGHELPVIWRE